MTRKWGSCSTAGTITVADDLGAQAGSFQDYVIVHELLHLKVPNHGKVFRALMSLHLPGWRGQQTGSVERTTRFIPRE
jgi:predicted metal-dependent hydrolase